MLGIANKINHIADTKRMSEKVNPSDTSVNPDQWYWDAIEKYKDNSKLYEYLSTNPHLRANNDPFSPNFQQQILSLFGDTSGEDAYYADLRSKANDFLKEATKGQYEQWYESPIEQVKRERAAGINSDLAPQMISSGEAAENDQPFSSPSMSGAGDTSFVHQMASFGLEFVSSVLSFGKQIQDLNLGAQQRISNEIGISNSAFDYVINQLAGLEPSSIKSHEDFQGFVRSLDLSTYSKPTRQFIKRYLSRFEKGDSLAMARLVSQLRNQSLRNNESSAEIMSSPYYSEDLNKWTQDIMEHYSKYVALSQQYQAMISSKRGEIESGFVEDNADALGENMEAELGAATTSANSAAEAAKFQMSMNKTWNELEKVVKGDGKHWYNTIGMILLQFLRAQVNQPIHFSAGFNAGISKSTSNANVISNSTSHSESLNHNYNHTAW